MYDRIEENLYRLGELKDYEVADEDPDVRGWNVYASDDKPIGTVEELIVDTEAMKVRYLDVRVRDDISGVDDHHMLIPIGAASIDEKEDIVRADQVETVTLLKYPKYEGGKVSRDYEDRLRKSYNPEYVSEEDRDYYSNEFYNEEKFYASRRKKNLFRLHEVQGYEIKGVDPDIRNWDVLTQDGKKIGHVYELIVDPSLQKIRYIEIDSVMNKKAADEDQHILIPIGLAALDESNDRVIVKADYNALTRVPIYRGGNITRSYEDSVKNSIFMDTLTAKNPDKEYYNNEYYNDSGFYGKRGSGVRWS